MFALLSCSCFIRFVEIFWHSLKVLYIPAHNQKICPTPRLPFGLIREYHLRAPALRHFLIIGGKYADSEADE